MTRSGTCLANSVLAMGSIALHDATSCVHKVFFRRAEEHLGLQAFGAAHMETVQALAILGGLYLHYVQQPNLANTLVGAALKTATTLGLHRDFSSSSTQLNMPEQATQVELRRRLWWCLLLMDAWNNNYLGRPTMGRFGPGITTKLPEAPVVGHVLSSLLPTLTSKEPVSADNRPPL